MDIMRRTKENCVIADGDTSYVLMDMRKYHALLLERDVSRNHLTDAGLIDKINREIALWHENQKEFFVRAAEESIQEEPSFSL